MNTTIISNTAMSKFKFKNGLLFKNPKNIRNIYRNGHYVYKAGNDFTVLFELGKNYDLKLRHGKNVCVKVYKSEHSGDIRISYMISSVRGVIFSNNSANRLSPAIRNILYRIAHKINKRPLAVSG